MKIALDLTPAEDNPAGIGLFAINLFSELVKLDKDNTYLAYSQQGLELQGAKSIVRPKLGGPLKGIRWMSDAALDMKLKQVDILISPSNHIFTHFFPNTYQFVHDLAPIRYPQFFSKKAAFMYKITTNMALSRAKRILTISNQVKQELEERFPEEKASIEVIYPGLNQWVTNEKPDKEILKKYKLTPDQYLIAIYTLEPRKNHINLIKGFAKFRELTGSKVKLAIAGKKGWYYDEIFSTVANLKLEKAVKFLGYVPNEDVSSLYKYAKASAMLSYYEGFGIPLVESLYFDLPTLASDIPVFREVLGEKALYTDPFDPDIIGAKLVELLGQKKPKTKQYILDNFTYARSAQKLTEVIKQAGTGKVV